MTYEETKAICKQELDKQAPDGFFNEPTKSFLLEVMVVAAIRCEIEQRKRISAIIEAPETIHHHDFQPRDDKFNQCKICGFIQK
jgi:hypothetical protein